MDAKTVELEHGDALAGRRDAAQHAVEDFRQRRLAAMGAGHRDLAHDAIALCRRLFDPVMEIRKGGEQRVEHLPHPLPANRSAVVLRVGGVERRGGCSVLAVDALLIETPHQRLAVLD
jgi:hypothetical protein